jgi:hypothetical protein
MSILRRRNCTHASSGIFPLCRRLYNTQVESGLQDITLENLFVLFIFLTQLTTLMLVSMVEFSCQLIFIKPCVLCCWLSWPLTLVIQSSGIKLTYIIMVVICNFLIEYGPCNVKQIYENVLNNVVKVTNGI